MFWRVALYLFLVGWGPFAQASVHGEQTFAVLKKSPHFPASVQRQEGLRFALESLVLPVLGSRSKFASFTLNTDSRGQTVLIVSSGTSDRKLGTYYLHFNETAVDRPAPSGLPQVMSSERHAKVSGTLTLPPQVSPLNLPNWQGQIRSLFRADPLFYPHLRPPVKEPFPIELSAPQQEALGIKNEIGEWSTGLRQFEDEHRRSFAAGPLKMGLMMPVAMGKTLVAARYAQILQNEILKTDAQIFFVVENTQILSEATDVFIRELGLRPNQVQALYEDSAMQPLNPHARAVFITRSTYFNRMDQIHAGLKQKSRSPRLVIFDEAHHLGKNLGQFSQIISELNSLMSVRDRILCLSALLKHSDSPIVTDLLGGKVYGIFLDDKEQASLRTAQDLERIARVQYFRAMQLGYISPLFSYTSMHYAWDTEAGQQVPIQHLLDQSQLRTVEAERGVEEGYAARMQALKREVVIHLPIVKRLAQELRRQWITQEGRTVIYDRGAIFVPTQAHANFYAFLLAREFAEEGIQFRPFHTGEGVDPATMGWFDDQDGQRARHKYILVVGKFDEGVDKPKTNHLIFLRNSESFLRILQNLGRGSRVSALKSGLRVTAFSDSLEMVLSELNSSDLAQVFVRPTKTNALGKPGLFIDEESVDTSKLGSVEREFLPRLEAVVEPAKESPKQPTPVAPVRLRRESDPALVQKAVRLFGPYYPPSRMDLLEQDIKNFDPDGLERVYKLIEFVRPRMTKGTLQPMITDELTGKARVKLADIDLAGLKDFVGVLERYISPNLIEKLFSRNFYELVAAIPRKEQVERIFALAKKMLPQKTINYIYSELSNVVYIFAFDGSQCSRFEGLEGRISLQELALLGETEVRSSGESFGKQRAARLLSSIPELSRPSTLFSEKPGQVRLYAPQGWRMNALLCLMSRAKTDLGEKASRKSQSNLERIFQELKVYYDRRQADQLELELRRYDERTLVGFFELVTYLSTRIEQEKLAPIIQEELKNGLPQLGNIQLAELRNFLEMLDGHLSFREVNRVLIKHFSAFLHALNQHDKIDAFLSEAEVQDGPHNLRMAMSKRDNLANLLPMQTLNESQGEALARFLTPSDFAQLLRAQPFRLARPLGPEQTAELSNLLPSLKVVARYGQTWLAQKDLDSQHMQAFLYLVNRSRSDKTQQCLSVLPEGQGPRGVKP